MLQDTGRSIVLTVPTKGLAGDDSYSRWFSTGFVYSDDPDRTRYSYSPPSVLIFQDHAGEVALVGCREVGMSASGAAGVGRIRAEFAILGGRSWKYEKVNGLRTKLPALAPWTGLRSVHPVVTTDADFKVEKVEIKMDSPPEVRISRRMNLTLSPSFESSSPNSNQKFEAHDVVLLSTTAKRAAAWEEHLENHLAIRELLSLSAWQSFGFSGLEVCRSDDPEVALNGDEIGPRWNKTVTHRLRDHSQWAKSPQFLFRFGDVGTKGVHRWLKLRSHFARTIQPLVGIADRKDSFLETQAVQSGIALEALGYQIEVDNGGSNLNGRGQLTYPACLDTILDDMPFVPLQNAAAWRQNSIICYSGLKHPDNPTPDSLLIANTLRQNLLVARFWIAGRLGCRAKDLEQRLSLDPLHGDYELL